MSLTGRTVRRDRCAAGNTVSLREEPASRSLYGARGLSAGESPGSSRLIPVLVEQVDLFASFAHMLGAEIEPGGALDSQDMYAALTGEDPVGRDELMMEDITCSKILRHGNWAYLEPSDGIPYMPKVRIETGRSKEPQLYNMDYDIGQRTNVAAEFPDVVKEMDERLRRIMASERTGGFVRR